MTLNFVKPKSRFCNHYFLVIVILRIFGFVHHLVAVSQGKLGGKSPNSISVVVLRHYLGFVTITFFKLSKVYCHRTLLYSKIIKFMCCNW